MKQTADGALELAKPFLRKAGVNSFWLQAVRRDPKGGQWRVVVRIDSILGPLKEVILDDATGAVVSYGDASPPPGPR